MRGHITERHAGESRCDSHRSCTHSDKENIYMNMGEYLDDMLLHSLPLRVHLECVVDIVGVLHVRKSSAKSTQRSVELCCIHGRVVP